MVLLVVVVVFISALIFPGLSLTIILLGSFLGPGVLISSVVVGIEKLAFSSLSVTSGAFVVVVVSVVVVVGK